MPKVRMDYSNTIFYKLVCNDLSINQIYIGHTLNFTKRKYRHKTSCTNPNNKMHHLPVYQFIRDNGNWENWNMVKISTENCETRLDALKKEREYIELHKATLNNRKPFITDEEAKQWWDDNRDRLNEKNKNYMKENEEYFKVYRKERYENKKDTILEQMKENYQKNRESKIAYQKQYTIDNKEKVSESKRDYYNRKKEEINEKHRQKVECECGEIVCIYELKYHKQTKKHSIKMGQTEPLNLIVCECGAVMTKKNLSRHLKTTKHQDYLKSLQPEETPEIID